VRPRCFTSQSTARHAPIIVVLALAAIAAITAVPASAPAKVVLGKAIAGVHLGDSRKQVRHELGGPRRIAAPSWFYGRPLLGYVSFAYPRRVQLISTRSHHQRTSAGVGPGSSLRRLHRTYFGAVCAPRGARGQPLVCTLTLNRGITEFVFRHRLARVTVYQNRVTTPP
jgi:hypothetical protein